MPLITDIKEQVKNPNKVSVFLDGVYVFSLTLNQLAEHKEVRINLNLEPEQVKALKKLSSLTNVYLNLLNLIYSRPRSEKEQRDKLRFKRLEDEEVEELISRLKTENHINDLEFALWWARNRKNSKPISTLKLKTELAQKGISNELVNQALEQEFTSEDELASLKNLILKKRSKYPEQDKLIAHLASKGFKYGDIKDSLNGLESDSEW